MPLHPSTFSYHSPTEGQKADMEDARAAARAYYRVLDALVPPGPDYVQIMHDLRTLAMWVNVAITRQWDGEPRE